MAKRRKNDGGNRSMLDLPLRGDEKQAEGEAKPAEAPAAAKPTAPAEPAAPPPPAERAVRPPAQDTHPLRRRRRRKRKKRRWPLVLILLLVIAALGYAYYQITTPRAGFSVQTLEFGEQRVGGATEPLEVTVTNSGSRAMTISGIGFRGDAAGDFAVVSDDCSESTREAGEACTIALAFQPVQNGWRTAALVLEGNVIGRLPLTGSGAAPVLIADRSEIDFGPQPVDGRGASRTLNLRNDGAAALAVDGLTIEGEHTADFDLTDECTGELPPSESCAVRIKFTPRAAGARAATLRVDSDGATGTAVITLAGNGVWSGAPLEADTEALEFGKQRRGRTSRTRSVTFVNRTSEPVQVGAVRLDAGESGFAVAEQNCEGQTLAAGAECSIDVQFTPKGEGATQAVVAVGMPDGVETSIELTGTGVEPRLKLERSELDFGSIRVGFESRARAVLTNTGTATVNFDTASLAGRDRGAFSKIKDGCSDFSLAPGRTCSIELRLIPIKTGDQRAELQVDSDAAGGRKTVSLSGSGTSAKVAITPARLDFGTVQRPGSKDLPLTLSNDGTARMQIQRFSVTGASAADFVVSSIGCGESGLEAGGSCRVTVRFAPRTDGARAARLVVQHDAGAALEVPLLGTALAARPGFRVSPGSMDFGSRPVGARSPVQTLTVTNTGDGRLELQRVSIEGAHARDYTLVPGTCDGAPYVAAKGSCTVGVRFTPSASGRRDATLRIQHNAGSGGTVRLSGQGDG